jgi:hypothetical protein
MADENAVIDDQIGTLSFDLTERRKIFQAQNLGNESAAIEKKLKSIRTNRKLSDLAHAQTVELAALREELDRLRERTFPSFAVQRRRQMNAGDDR